MHFFSFLILIFAACISASEYCKLDTNACSCIADNGWGVDLRNISGKELMSGDAGLPFGGYIVSLCQDSKSVPSFVNGTNNCGSGFSICKITRVATVDTKANATIISYDANPLLAGQKWTGINKANEENALTFGYSATANLRMVCVKDKIDETLVVGQGDNLLLFTPTGCLSLLRPPPVVEGLGTGAVISIIILVTLFSYFTLGIVYNYFSRGIRGAELIPNIDFWRDLPGLVMDGIRFIQNGCKPAGGDMAGSAGGGSGRDTYDSI